MTKERIETILINEIKELYQIEIKDINENLLHPRVGIAEGDFIYLYKELKEKYNIDIYPVIAQNDCDVFTIDNLSQKIVDLYDP